MEVRYFNKHVTHTKRNKQKGKTNMSQFPEV